MIKKEPPSGSQSEPLRIGLYAPALPGSEASNGIVTYTGVIRDTLRALGNHVFVVTTEFIEHPDGSVDRLPKLRPLPAALRLRISSAFGKDPGEAWVWMNVQNAFEAARRAGVQVFEMEESFGWAGRLAGKGVAIVERLHGPHKFIRNQFEPPWVKARGDCRENAEFASFRKVQAITAPTQELIDSLVPYGLDPTVARVIPNPMPAMPERSTWRVEEADPNQILFVGRFDLCKGADVAVKAFTDAALQNKSLKMVMVGPDIGLAQPDDRNIHCHDFLAEHVPAQLRSRIQFLGPVAPDRITELRRQSSFTIVTSRFETFGYIIAEAMAVGMPVLTSATFGGLNLVRDGIDGLVVPIGDIKATAAAITRMTNNPGLAAMGQSAYRRVRDRLSPERIGVETLTAYREAIGRS